MTFKVLWPTPRWDDDKQVEMDSVTPGGEAMFFKSADTVTEQAWRSADAIVCYHDIEPHHRAMLDNIKIFVTHKVGFDNIDLAAWDELGIPVCNCLLYTSPSPRDLSTSRMPSSA